MDFLSQVYFGNSVRDWAVAVAASVATHVVLRLIASRGVARVAKLADATRSNIDDVLVAVLQATKGLVLFVIAIYVGVRFVVLPAQVETVIGSVTVIALLVQTGMWASAGILRWVTFYAEARAEEDASAVMAMSVLSVAARIAVWSLVVLLILDNLGVDITAMVAGLGIGGVAVALAAQNVLGDLFASLSIILDKPFVLGDFLIVGDHMGSVEHIGLKTTRMRSLSGEQLVFSNQDLLGSRIRNYGRMEERRVLFKLGVTYQTPRAELEAIPGLIKEIIESRENTRFDRSHLQAFGDFSIDFETVYYMLVPDYAAYMDVQQDVYLAIHRAFEERGIEFAYPTQTIFLEKE